MLAARKANLITARARKNKRTARMLANARTDHSIPLTLCLCVKTRQEVSHENGFDFHENKPIGGAQLHVNGLAQRLVLTQRRKTSRKWPLRGLFTS